MYVVVASCDEPKSITNGRKDGRDFRHGGTVTYSCSGSYVLEGQNQLTCNDGQWNARPPKCKGNK